MIPRSSRMECLVQDWVCIIHETHSLKKLCINYYKINIITSPGICSDGLNYSYGYIQTHINETINFQETDILKIVTFTFKP